jgi:gliding motility-associated lipoprotein GldD
MKWMNTKSSSILSSLLVSSCILFSCSSEPPIPKPVGYFRIDLPKNEYQLKAPPCPFSFEASKLSRLEFYENEEAKDECWFDLHYPSFKAKIHITYKPVEDNLREFIEESRTLTYEHQIKANSIKTVPIINESSDVYGLAYDLGGSVASPYQFYLTDSTKHFLRGSLYFTARPNPDSIQPVLDFIKEDLEYLTSTFKWQD